jgi:hypothetical protein
MEGLLELMNPKIKFKSEKMKHVLKIFLLFAFIIAGCSSVNELSKFNLSSQKFLFKHSVKSSLTKIKITSGTTVSGDKNIFDILIEDVGGSYVSSEVQKKLDKIFDPEYLAGEISEGVEEALITYYNAVPVKSLTEDPAYIAETRLEEFEIISSSSGIFTKITAEVKITSRRTGAMVWKNREVVNIPFEENRSSYTADKTEKNIRSVVNLARLLDMSEEELKSAIDNTSSQVGYNLSDNLREDIANSRKKN